MDWSTIITDILSYLFIGGGLVAVVTLKDKKSEAVLENITRFIENSDKSNAAWQKLFEESNRETDDLKADLEKKDKKIDELFKAQSLLRDRNDKLSSKVSFLNCVRCTQINCTNRRPPFGSESNFVLPDDVKEETESGEGESE